MENGTNQANIFQLICFLNMLILETELEKVPKVRAKGTWEAGRKIFNIGIRIKLAPPPHIALIQKAMILPANKMNNSNSIFDIV